MTGHSWKFRSTLCVIVIGGAILAATLATRGQTRPSRASAEPKTSKDIAGELTKGPEHYLNHVMTDKPVYRPGEKIYVRSVVLRSSGHAPRPDSDKAGYVHVEIKGPKGDVVANGNAAIADGAAGYSWAIPPGQPGGEYTVRVWQPTTGDPAGVRKFDIRSYRAPRLKSQIVFLRDGYGPGDTVNATAHVERAEGGNPAGAKVVVTARVDGEEVWKGETTVDAAGNAGASFPLPTAIVRGEGTLAMAIEDGGTVETAAKTIPIILQTLDLSIYPEGGDLVAGLLNRVYVEGRTPAGKPADMAGAVVNAAGREVGVFRTEHEGRGRFSFVPETGESYSLRLSEPAGIQATFPLPPVKESGVVLAAASDITARHKDVVVRVAPSAAGVYRVALSQRGKEFAQASVTLKARQAAEVSVAIPRAARFIDGVVVATVYDNESTPMAERLLFIQPARNLKVQVTPDRTDYVPGDKVTLRVVTTDDTGKPVPAVVGLTVTDSSVLEMIDTREQAPRLPAMVLLESDVKDLADAHVYLDETNPKAPLATDLLLGTQGWRRFATVNPVKFLMSGGDAATRALSVRLVNDPVAAGAMGNIAGNDLLTLITTLPGYRANPLGSEFDTVGGLPMMMMNTVRDGLSVTDGFFAGGVGANTILNPDMISEIRLILAPVDAEAGRGNGQVQITTKSGTNRFQWGVGAGVTAGGLLAPPGSSLASPNAGPLFPPSMDAEIVRQAKAHMIREYAHKLPIGWIAGSRSDFAETVYWNAAVKTNSRNGSATVSFNLSDSVTSFRVLADAFAKDGTLGASITEIESVQPFSVEPKLPLQVTGGDVIQLPIAMINGTRRDLDNVSLTWNAAPGLVLAPADNGTAILRAKERARGLVEIKVPTGLSGVQDLKLDAGAGPYSDSVQRKLDVQPLGYPYERSFGGVLEPNASASHEFTLPAELVPGSVSTNVVIYPTPLANLTEALQALIREPYGCFEQTSSTSYPMVMAQQYFLTHSGIDPSIIEKAKGLLEASYKRLTGFESRTKGYEWFGGDPGHEALTAYGLLQFTDMSRVRQIDGEMLQRTRAWLLSRRDGDGGFKRDSRGHGSGIGSASTETTNVYITWALAESGERGLEREIAAVKALASSGGADSYIIALAANILQLAGDHAGARQMMDKLVTAQLASGVVSGGRASITRSGGESLAIETTALSLLAWMRAPAESPYANNVARGIRWIAESNRNGRFGSTQSTVLALRAIVAYDAAQAIVKVPGRVQMIVDGKPIGEPMAFTAEMKGAIVMPEFGAEFGPGKHTIALTMEDGSAMPFSMSLKYNSTLPDSAPQTQVGVHVVLKDVQVQEGAATEAMVTIRNRTADAVPTPVAIVGIPGGLEVRHDQLKELVKAGRIDAYEVIGREVVLYWRALGANAQLDLPVSLIAAVPGWYTGPASRAYLYYTPEYKDWAPGLNVRIAPR